ncbi:MAG TPA: hypothetical protein VJS19_02710 [Candidatus Dormibacteraeota bacterium]|nr:hypothetical protein [Candidatus Dormibacteraeota bacterium]
MSRPRLELRDLRSLDRRSMYSIFHPLDPNERLPRELILEGRRSRWLEKRALLTWVGMLYLPALMLTVVVLGSFKLSALIAFGAAGMVLLGVYIFVMSAKEP